MKKIVSMMVLAMLLALAACGDPHTHAAEVWELSGKEHWKTCECGEEFDRGAHTLDDMDCCTACGAEVIDWGDSVDVTCRDAQGNPTCYLSYDANGNLVGNIRIDYTYDESGNVTGELHYDNDVLAEEYAYEGGVLTARISYYPDGTKQISLYDAEGNLLSAVNYDAEDQMTMGIYSEYAQDADGNWYECRNTTVDEFGCKYVGEYNECGDQILWATYDPDGNVENHERYEITYNEEGQKDTVKTYSHDVLVQEMVYTLVTYEDGWMNYPGTITDYHEDGTKTVSVFDENDQLLSQTHYDADGNVFE